MSGEWAFMAGWTAYPGFAAGASTLKGVDRCSPVFSNTGPQQISPLTVWRRAFNSRYEYIPVDIVLESREAVVEHDLIRHQHDMPGPA